MRLLDLMTPDPVTVSPNTTVEEATAVLEAHGFRHLPIVAEGRLVGIVTDRDLRSSRSSLPMPLADLDVLFAELRRPVHEVGTTHVLVFGPDGQVRDAIDAMIDERVGAVCVVDEDDRLLGIVSYIDVLRVVRELVPRGLARRHDGTIGRTG